MNVVIFAQLRVSVGVISARSESPGTYLSSIEMATMVEITSVTGSDSRDEPCESAVPRECVSDKGKQLLKEKLLEYRLSFVET